MTTKINCRIYYSVTGNHFRICDRLINSDLANAIVELHVHTTSRTLALHGMEEEAPMLEYETQFSIAGPIRSSGFFSHSTECIFINGKNQILKIDGTYRISITMYRDFNDPSKLLILFPVNKINDQPDWISL